MKLEWKANALILILIFILLYLTTNSLVANATPLINEIMINPLESDATCEWIELFNPTNHCYNLSEWTLSDNLHIDTLKLHSLNANGTFILSPNQYCIITDIDTDLYNKTVIPIDTLLLTVDDKSIGNGLGNTKDKLILYNKTGYQIDAVEWGYDYIDIPGEPYPSITEDMSLIRTTSIDTNNTLNDFKESCTPTPGIKNIFSAKGSISLKTVPKYMPKAYGSESDSFPVSLQIQLDNFTTSPYYEMKVAIIANTSKPSIASQTWDTHQWQYSDRYLFNITTNITGSYRQWVHLRFHTSYQAYKNLIISQPTAFVQVKIRDKNSITEYTQEIHLLDMDISTMNAVPGGYYVTRLTDSDLQPVHNQRLILMDNDQNIMSIYSTENNSIDEGFSSKNGFIKLPAPKGTGYTLSRLNDNNQQNEIKNNITINQGRYDVAIHSNETSYKTKPEKSITIPVTIENKGDFNDTYSLSVIDISHGWYARIPKTTLFIPAKTKKHIIFTVHPDINQRYEFHSGSVTLLIQSITDLDCQHAKAFDMTIIAPDLTIPTIKTYNTQWDEITSIEQGCNLKIKAYCKNRGNKNATMSCVSFYYDKVNNTNLLGKIIYENIGSYQKYPSITVDTCRMNAGEHTIYVCVDIENTIKELDEQNNIQQTTINLINTTPSPLEKTLLITEFYYYTHPGIKNEYLCIHNPSYTSIDISDFYITNNPFNNHEDQCKIQFPDQTIIPPHADIFITQNAEAFCNETGFNPDFEYKNNSIPSISQMIGSASFTLSNNGDSFALKNRFNHTIDFVCYGNITQNIHTHWRNGSIPLGSAGQVFKRIKYNNTYSDTDTKEDFNHSRYFFIGQTDLQPISFQGDFSFTSFVSPDSSYQAIVNALAQAEQRILLNMYEFTNVYLCNELITCLQRDINITILMEGSPVGGISDEEWYLLNRLSFYGAHIYFIMQDSQKDIYARYPFNHAKYAIIDQDTCIIESCNWADTGVPVNPSFGNREWGIIVHDQNITEYLSTVFFKDCNQSSPDIIPYETLNHSIPKDFFIDPYQPVGQYSPSFSMLTLNTTATVTPVFSPDTSLSLIQSLIKNATESICIQQLYIYSDWDGKRNPLIQELIEKANQGLSIRIILNYNPSYTDTNNKCNMTKALFESYGIEVRYIYTNSSCFSNIHNKGLIIDNTSVLISSINWNENSLLRNREVGLIIKSEEIASYYYSVFLSDWNINYNQETENINRKINQNILPENILYIIGVYALTFMVIVRDWRHRKWD